MSLPNYAPAPFQRRRTRIWIVLGSIVGVLVLAALVTGAVVIALHTFFQQTDQPAPVAASYYLAFMTQDYAKAYAELDSQATINGQKVDEQTFRNLATTADAQQGKVTSYSLDGSDSASHFTVTVHRGGQNYTVHLQLKLEGSVWKIISADGIQDTQKERFPTFWPKWDHFYKPLTGIAPGEVALINMVIPGDVPHRLPLSTGVLGALCRRHFGVVEPVQTHVVCIDPRVQWSQFWNIWQNAATRTFLYRMLTPVRWMLRYVSREAPTI